MPDITMCQSEDCPVRNRCYRNQASGTKPVYYQSWFMVEPKHGPNGCLHFWEVKDD